MDNVDKVVERVSADIATVTAALAEKLTEMGPEALRLWGEMAGHTSLEAWVYMLLVLIVIGFLIFVIAVLCSSNSKADADEGTLLMFVLMFVLAIASIVLMKGLPEAISTAVHPEGKLVKEFILK